MTLKARKIVKIEDITRPESDFLLKPKIGYTEIRARYAGKKLDVPYENTLTSTAKTKNICIKCSNEAQKKVYVHMKGAVQIERYCLECFDRVVDLDKMEMQPEDISYIEKIS